MTNAIYLLFWALVACPPLLIAFAAAQAAPVAETAAVLPVLLEACTWKFQPPYAAATT